MDLLLRRNQALSYDDGTDALIDRSITRATSQITSLVSNQFRGCAQLEYLNMPYCTGLGDYAFYGCAKLKDLKTVGLTIDNGVLTTTSKRTGVGSYLFYGCNSITEIDAQSITSINQYAFSNCAGLTSVNIPNVTTLNNYVFQNCTKLTTINAPKVYFLYTGSLNNIGAQYLVLPSMRQTQASTVLNSSKLLGVDFGGTISGTTSNDKLNNYTFQGCTQLSTLVLRSSVMWPLNSTNAFTNTPFASGKAGGTLYVPQDLIESYQAATNWSTILGYATNQILPIEGSIYETHYVDGTPIPTGYQEVEYIESNGSSSFITNLTLPNAPIEITSSCTYKRTSNTPTILEVENSNLKIWNTYDYESGVRYVRFDSGSTGVSAQEQTSSSDHPLNYTASITGVGENNTITFNGTLDGYSFSVSKTGTTGDYTNSSITIYMYGKIIGHLVIKSNNEIIYDFMPCYRRIDEVIGLYENITGTFFSGGTSKGADVT